MARSTNGNQDKYLRFPGVSNFDPYPNGKTVELSSFTKKHHSFKVRNYLPKEENQV